MLQELEKERVCLRNKSALIEAEVKKMDSEIKKDFLNKKTGMPKQGANDPANRFEDYQCKLIRLIAWIEPHITKQINYSRALTMVKCALPYVILEGVCFLDKATNVGANIYKSGAPT